MNRREFIKQVAIGGGGVALLSAVPAFSQPSASAATVSGASQGQYLVGTVLSAAPGSLVVSNSQSAAVAVSLPSTARVWRGALTDAGAIQVGDQVRAWVTPQSTQLVVAKIWANIAQIRGIVSAVGNGSFTVDELKSQRSHAIATTATTSFSAPSSEALQENAPVFVIGYRDPVTNIFTATLVDFVTLS
jgi:hypothetical protein